jgi:hypothetical protein
MEFKMERFNLKKIPRVQADFLCVDNNQKVLLDVLLNYSSADLTHLSVLLGVSESELRDVLSGDLILPKDLSKELSTLFLIFFGA